MLQPFRIRLKMSISISGLHFKHGRHFASNGCRGGRHIFHMYALVKSNADLASLSKFNCIHLLAISNVLKMSLGKYYLSDIVSSSPCY